MSRVEHDATSENKGSARHLPVTLSRGRNATEPCEHPMTTHPILTRLKALQPSPRQRRAPLATEPTGRRVDSRRTFPRAPVGSPKFSAPRPKQSLRRTPRPPPLVLGNDRRRPRTERARTRNRSSSAPACSLPALPKKCATLRNGFSSIRKPPASREALAPIRFSSASPGGTPVASK